MNIQIRLPARDRHRVRDPAKADFRIYVRREREAFVGLCPELQAVIEGVSVEHIVSQGNQLIATSLCGRCADNTPRLFVYLASAEPGADRRVPVAHLYGDLDVLARAELDRELMPLIDATEAIIDVTDVVFAGSALLNAVARLLAARTVRLGRTEPLRIVGASALTRRIFQATQLDALVLFYDSVRAMELQECPAIVHWIDREAYAADASAAALFEAKRAEKSFLASFKALRLRRSAIAGSMRYRD